MAGHISIKCVKQALIIAVQQSPIMSLLRSRPWLFSAFAIAELIAYKGKRLSQNLQAITASISDFICTIILTKRLIACAAV